jgi:hypothetical protein
VSLVIGALGTGGALIPSSSQASPGAPSARVEPVSAVVTTSISACSSAGQLTVVAEEPAEGNVVLHVTTRGLEPGSRWDGVIYTNSADFDDSKTQFAEITRRARDGGFTADAEFDPTNADSFGVVFVSKRKTPFCAVGFAPRKPLLGISFCHGQRSIDFLAARRPAGQLALHAFSVAKPGSTSTLSMVINSDGLVQTFDSQLVAGKHGAVHVKKIIDYVAIEAVKLVMTGPGGRSCRLSLTQQTSDIQVTRAPLAPTQALRACPSNEMGCSRLESRVWQTRLMQLHRIIIN